MNPVVVIGAGLAGLSAACYLKGRGYDVTVVEQEQLPGGRAGVLHRDGFTFDTGPTVLTMPDLIADAIRAATGDRSRDLGELLPMRRLDPAYRACFADGSTINVRYGREAMRDEIANTCGSVDAAAFDSFVDWLRQLYVLEMPKFIDRNYDSPLGLLSSPRALAQLLRLGAFGRLGGAVRKRFADSRLHRLFSFQSMYAGLSPDSALALYAVITYMDTIEGVWFPEGGMHAVPTVMAQVAEKAGAILRYGDPVETILRSPVGRVAGVRTRSGARIMADAVVCTLDLPTAYQELLGDLRPPRAARDGRYSPSAVLWHVGAHGVPQSPVAHHNIHFGEEWSSAFEALQEGRLMPDPSRLVTVPSLDDPTMAPTGCSTLYVLEPVPNLHGKINWSTESNALRLRLHKFLAGQGYPSEVITEKLVTPLDWQTQGMAAGTPFALGPHLRSDWALPSLQCRAATTGDVLRRVRDSPGRGRAYGAHLRQAGGQSSRGIPWGAKLVSDWNSYEAQLAEGYRRCAKLTWRYGTTYFWGATLLPKPQRKHVHASMPCAGWPMTLLISQMEINLAALSPAIYALEPGEAPESGSSTSSTHNTDVPAEPEPTMPDPDPFGPDLGEGRGPGTSQAQLTC